MYKRCHQSLIIFALVSLTYYCVIFPLMGNPQKTLNVNIICWDNGVGLSRDFTILNQEITRLGHAVAIVPIKPNTDILPKEIHQADVNIFIEHSQENLFSYASKNYFIPNPEWGKTPLDTIQKFDVILCRTHEVERIFATINPNTYYLGFTSIDRYEKAIPKDNSKLFHLRGKSPAKGTNAIIETWKHRPDYPLLTILAYNLQNPELSNINLIGDFLSEKKLIKLQNECGIHLCPSETEGFGHYIGEAMSVGAVIITTDAPPMNEFIKDKRCLVNYGSQSNQKLATTYFIDPEHFEYILDNLLALSESELKKIGSNNRKAYLEQKKAFKERLKALFNKEDKLD